MPDDGALDLALPLPLPLPTAATAPYWAAAAEGRLMLQRCRTSGAIWHYPRQMSSASGDQADVEWFEASGRGVVYSFSIVRRAPDPVFQARAPYPIALIDLAEGPRMLASIVGPGALAVAIGDAVRCVFEARGKGMNVPQFIREGI